MRELLVGDLAPSFAFSEFLRGEPVWALERGKIHVVEFWATTCGPCRGMIPELTKLQADHPDIVVIGVVALEQDVEKARAFVAEQGEEIGYRIALQAPSPERRAGSSFAMSRDPGRMTADWMDASFSIGVPQSFLIDASGRVAWIGHPFELHERLDALLAGRIDVVAAAAAYREEIAAKKTRERFRVHRAFDVSLETKNYAEFFRVLEETAAEHPEVETRFVGVKLRLLIQEGDAGRDEALAYARRASEGVARDDDNALLVIGFLLITTKIDGRERPQSSFVPEYAELGVEILRRVEPKLAPQPQLHFQFCETFSRGLAAAGRYDEALERIARARGFAAEAGLASRAFASLDELESFCRERASSKP